MTQAADTQRPARPSSVIQEAALEPPFHFPASASRPAHQRERSGSAYDRSYGRATSSIPTSPRFGDLSEVAANSSRDGPYRSPSLPPGDLNGPRQHPQRQLNTNNLAVKTASEQTHSFAGQTSPVGSATSDPGPSYLPIAGPSHQNGQETRTPSPKTSSQSKTKNLVNSACQKCQLPVTGQFVRALGSIHHLECFKCADCGKVVAQKFFPVDRPDGGQFPLCETDYFRRLNLLCAKCGCALRGSYITALDKKFHVEHFTCSVCETVFGPQDSYYEHEEGVYCHFHYSTRFAVKCTGCQSAILKQFVEINRYDKDEHWHPECYMIHKFWNTKVVGSSSAKRKGSAELKEESATESAHASDDQAEARPATGEPVYLLQEARETPDSLREKQRTMEEKVYRIWTVLSTFEESSAACISEMLKYVSNSLYFEAVGMAEKFVVHVETLFAAIDDLNTHFHSVHSRDISHVREARMLCKKIVNFFSLLSHTSDSGARKVGISHDLLSLVTGLAHYLKILIRIALTASLRIERERHTSAALTHFLNRLDRLARDPEATKAVLPPNAAIPERAEKRRIYGYKSLPRASGTLVGSGEATTDLCEGCRGTVEEECVRLGISARWHLYCLKCTTCGRAAALPPSKERDKEGAPIPVVGPLPLPISDFRIEPRPPDVKTRPRISCRECGGYPSNVTGVFDAVTRLEQYAFLLSVALNKLFFLLKQRGMLSAPAAADSDARSIYDTYRDSTEIKRMKSVNLDRKLSTNARTPKRSTVIESPVGRTGLLDSGLAMTKTTENQQDSQKQPSRQTNDGKPQRPPPFDPEKANFARPYFGRSLTAVKVVEDNPRDEPPPLGYPEAFRMATEDEQGITLADLPQVMEAEQARADHVPPPRRQTAPFLSDLSTLEYVVVKHAAALLLTNPDAPLHDVISLEDLLDLIEARKNTFWGKIFKGGNEKKAVKKKGVFGIALDGLIERGGVESIHGAGPNPVIVPAFVDDVISAMKQMDMSVEGVFRKNGNIRKLKELSDALDRDPTSVNLMDENPVQLAALLKKFLRELPDPLFTFKMHHLYMATQRIENEQDRINTLHLVCCLLPRSHRETAEVLFIFLKWVASFSHIDEETGSRMDLTNLATVVCPNILYARGRDPTKDESFLSIRTISDMLEQQDRFWQVPDSIGPILQHQESLAHSEVTSKDILRHCRQFVSPKFPSLHQTASFTSHDRGSPNERPLSWQVSPHTQFQPLDYR